MSNPYAKPFCPQATALVQQYNEHLHALQTATMTAYAHGNSPEAQGVQQHDMPRVTKHLRVGIDAARLEIRALVHLCIAHGVFTDIDYARSILAEVQDDIAIYEKQFGIKFL